MTDNILVVIVNYRTADLVVACIQSIASQFTDLPNLRIVVVDNASGDGSKEKLNDAIMRQRWGGRVSLLPLERNGGFAYGNNAGIRRALQSGMPVDYIFLLNPDTIVLDNAIRVLVDFMNARPLAGIAGSRLFNPAGELESSAHNDFSPIGELESGAKFGPLSRTLNRYATTPPIQHTAHECGWVSGASLMIKRVVFESIGPMDDGYFLYFEEADYCLRARRAGWQVWYVPESGVTHMEGASTAIRDTTRRRPRYWYDSRRRYFIKHFGVAGLIIADVLMAVGRSSLYLRRALGLSAGGDRRTPKYFIFDILWGDLCALLKFNV